MRMSLRTAGVLGVVLFGCSLDITRITFDLPKQTYSFNTSMWVNLPPAAAGVSFPSIPCSSDAQCCMLAAAANLDCNTTPLTCPAGTCEADVPESAYSPINLAMQVPQLATFPGHSLVKVSIASIKYVVSDNTLNVDLPEMQIYLAPDGVTDASDASAMLFGTIPPIPAGTDPAGAVEKAPNADAVLQMYTSNVSQTFNVIAKTTVVIAAGTPVPNGQITVTVTGAVSAQL
ncbi:MAG TPA: hypothetical protein VHO67_15895 [Polyangia bacterium]|nr:hypothetical protein [Polyangia bacterium]